MFVATTGKVANNFVQLKIDGNKYYQVGSYNFKYNGNLISVSGVNILTKTTDSVTFLCKSGKIFYTGTINPSSASGDINLTQKFKLDYSIGTVDYNSFVGQGFNSNVYSSKFEIEGCGIRNGKLYFNTNRVNASTGAQSDKLHYFTSYVQ